jgi:hypothetical protein
LRARFATWSKSKAGAATGAALDWSLAPDCFDLGFSLAAPGIATATRTTTPATVASGARRFWNDTRATRLAQAATGVKGRIVACTHWSRRNPVQTGLLPGSHGFRV